MAVCSNALATKSAAGQLCKASQVIPVSSVLRTALGVRMVTNPLVVQIAKNAGFDSLFIDLEHSTLSIQDAGNICSAGLLNGITPFVRVPHQCGNGFVQKVMDAGAMGVIFPHVRSAVEAKAAVSISKYPPLGCRSMTGQLPIFGMKATPADKIIQQSNESNSSVIVMIEDADALDRIDEIAAVQGVDVLLVGTNDLAVDLGVAGQFGAESFLNALETVSAACRKHGKIMGMAGIYGKPDLQRRAIHELGVRFMLCQQDSGILAAGAAQCFADVDRLEKGENAGS